jgi:predicted nucleic-acid-binding protein
MIGLDTNVVVRYLTQDDPAQSKAATELFAALTPSSPGFIPLVVWAEVYWVLVRTYGFPAKDAVDTLRDLFTSDEIVAQAEQQVRTALAEASAGADFPDALIFAANNEAGCTESVTFDTKAAKRVGFRLLATR